MVMSYVLGDPQASFAAVMGLLARYDLLGADGRLRGDAHLISIGDHFDYDLRAPEVSGREGLAVLRWLASHPPEQVTLLFGNHDAARVVELARVSDREFADARALALELEETKRAQGRAAAKTRERAELLPRFPVSTYGIVSRDYASFTTEQRALVVELLLAGRFHLARTGTLVDGREVLVTHAGVTEREVALLGVPAEPRPLASALEQLLATAIAARRDDWQRGSITPLSLEPVSQAGAPGEEAGGLLAHRPTNPDRDGADLEWEFAATRPRRFAPRELPRGLTQVAGHTNHTMCLRELAVWATAAARAEPHAGLRTLRATATAITYDLGVLPVVADAADLILIDGELRDPDNRAELLALRTET
jgi:hypothetical protein